MHEPPHPVQAPSTVHGALPFGRAPARTSRPTLLCLAAETPSVSATTTWQKTA